MIGYTYFYSICYENRNACFPNFGAARTPYLMYDVYTNDSLHGMCFPTVIPLSCEFRLLEMMQRGSCSKFIDELHVGKETFTQDNIISGWYTHFKKLATKTENPDYDLKYLKQVEEEVEVIFSICTNTTEEVKLISDKEIHDALKSLNRGKAPDVYGVNVEHLVFGGQNLIDILKLLMNRILLECSRQFETGNS